MSDQPQDNKQSQSDFARRLGVFAWICVAIIFLWSLSWLFIDASIVSDELRGQFGDKFGAINSLFSGLAFATLIYALFLQMEELRLQRKELELTRNEMRGQKEEFSEQNKTLKQQRFENTFFQMLSKYNEIVTSISEFRPDGGVKSGRVYLAEIVNSLNYSVSYLNAPPAFDNVMTKYSAWYSDNEHLVGHYFRFLSKLFDLIDRSDVEDKQFYADIVKSSLSKAELTLLFYNCFADGGIGAKRYLEKYALLEDMPVRYLPMAYMYKWHDASAYGGEYPHVDDAEIEGMRQPGIGILSVL